MFWKYLWKKYNKNKPPDAKPETSNYGEDRTIHQTNHLDIETDRRGNVVGVWFRCLSLPFIQTRVDENRADQMRSMYLEYDGDVYPKITSINIITRHDDKVQGKR